MKRWWTGRTFYGCIPCGNQTETMAVDPPDSIVCDRCGSTKMRKRIPAGVALDMKEDGIGIEERTE